jgi:perosamine synthetase
MKKLNLPVCSPLLSGNELAYVTEAVSTGWISSSGKYVTEFDKS